MRKVLTLTLTVIVCMCTLLLASCDDFSVVITPNNGTTNNAPDHVHTEVIIPAVNATCTEAGLTEGKKCADCGEILQQQTPTDKLEHTPIIVDGYASTCSTEGLTDGTKCSVCDKVLVEQTKIETVPHEPGEWITIANPTKTEDGCKQLLCNVCNDPYEEIVIPNTGSNGLLYELNSTEDGYVVVHVGNCTDTEIVVPREYKGLPVVEIGEAAFASWDAENAQPIDSSITSIILPNTITTINAYAFMGTSINEIIIPDSVTKIGGAAFAYSRLYTIEFGDGITSIPDTCCAYSECLNTVILGSNVVNIDATAFYGCTIISRWHMSAEQASNHNIVAMAYDLTYTNNGYATHPSVGVYLYTDGLGGSDMDSEGRYLMVWGVVDTSITEFTLPDGYALTLYGTFKGCESLTTVHLGEGVEHVMDFTFADCTSLTTVYLPSTLKTIGQFAFSTDSNITDIYYNGTYEDFWTNVEIPPYTDFPYYTEGITWHFSDRTITN